MLLYKALNNINDLLQQEGVDFERLAQVFQYNKRDLQDKLLGQGVRRRITRRPGFQYF